MMPRNGVTHVTAQYGDRLVEELYGYIRQRSCIAESENAIARRIHVPVCQRG